MPCHDDGRGYPDEKQKRLDLATRVACAAMLFIEEHHSVKRLDSVAFVDNTAWRWWEEHRRADAERLSREEAAADASRLRKAALSRLTPEEIEALGIKK